MSRVGGSGEPHGRPPAGPRAPPSLQSPLPGPLPAQPVGLGAWGGEAGLGVGV